MPSSLIVTFTDPDEYAASVRQGAHPIVFTQRAHTVKLTRIDLHRLWIQLLQRFAAGLSDEVGAGAPPSHSSWPEPLSTDTLPLDEIASIGGSIAGYELMSPNDDASITRSPEAMANLQRRHGAPRQHIVGE